MSQNIQLKYLIRELNGSTHELNDSAHGTRIEYESVFCLALWLSRVIRFSLVLQQQQQTTASKLD
jgi:hypothetical protein